ncbi:MAG: response regulator [Desulfamplus sp.]|nr:response regulator [Desulfamplus sp.]
MKKEQIVLIVDDNPTNLSVLTEHLKTWGFDFMVARNGESGIKKAIQGKPDLILLDIYMPGMDGFEVCHKLRSNPNTVQIPIIFLTANISQTDKIKGLDMGAVDYITKPFEAEEVLARINRHLEINRLRKQLETQNSQILLQNSKLEEEILKRKYIEDELKEREAMFRGMFEYHSAPMILILPKSGWIIKANQAAANYYGYSIQELEGMLISNINQESSDVIFDSIKKAVSNVCNVFGFKHKLKNGEIRDVEVHSSPIPWYGGRLLFSIIHDTTDRKLAETKQRELDESNLRLQKAESLSRMAGGVAHLFNNYLYVVTGNLEMAIEEVPNNAPIRENLIEAMNAALRSADVSGMMLTYLGQTITKSEALDITEFCRNNLSTFQSSIRDKISVEVDLSDSEVVVNANAAQMQQIMHNLFSNACESIKDNSDGCKIRLGTKIVNSSDIQKMNIFPAGSTLSEDKYGCIEVSDTGCGISEDDMHKIFDPFFTTKFTGRGLGLAVILGIVKSWGGIICVDSKLNHGSCFMVCLPLSLGGSIKQTKEVHREIDTKNRATILLVEDHDMVRKMTTVMLRRLGFDVVPAANGNEAIKLFSRHNESISCLITDLSMPGIDGWETLAEIRKIQPNIPAVLTSGYDEASAMSGENIERPQVFLHKPYSMDNLKIALEQALFKDA